MKTYVGKFYQSFGSIFTAFILAVSCTSVAWPIFFSQKASAWNIIADKLELSSWSLADTSISDSDVEINTNDAVVIKAEATASWFGDIVVTVTRPNTFFEATPDSGLVSAFDSGTSTCSTTWTPSLSIPISIGSKARANFCYKALGSMLKSEKVNFKATLPWKVFPLHGKKVLEDFIRIDSKDEYTKPVITLKGANPVDVTVGSIYADAGATAFDNLDGDISSDIVTVIPVDTITIGTYTVTYNVSDDSGNTANEVTRTVNVVDKNKPIISLLGSSPVTVELGSTYTDAGATASDFEDGDITTSINTVNPVNTSMVGTYVVTYDVADSDLNNALQVTRTVYVVDTTAPVISGVPADINDFEATNPDGEVITYALPTATDNGQSIPVVCAPVSGSLFTIDETIVYCTSNDGFNVSTVSFKVTIVDTTAPVISLIGTNPITIEVGTVYTDAGATASDIFDGDISSEIVTVNPVDSNTIGEYTVTYNIKDSSNNVATEVTRTVKVVDKTAPVINHTGSTVVDNTITPIITLSDNVTSSAEILFSWEADINNPVGMTFNSALLMPTFTVTNNGTYSVKLTATDKAGNSSNHLFAFTYTAPVVVPPTTPTEPTTTTTTPTSTPTTTLAVATTYPQEGNVLGTNTEAEVDEPDINGSEGSTTQKGEVASATTKKDDNSGIIFGIMWYWWLPILAALAAIWWFIIFRRRKDEDKK